METPSRQRASSSTPAFSLAPLRHPLWWAALMLLLINDHVLKGSGVVPGWLTGKISDFAFLIVAPVLLAAFLPVRFRPRRVVALVAVVAIYVAADVSPTVSDVVVSAAARLGMTWRLWPDLTDLLALVVLPGAWRLMGVSAGDTRRRAPALEATAVALGALACLATSAPTRYPHAPFVVNRTDGPVDVTVTWVFGSYPCGSLPALRDQLGRDDLGESRRITLGRGLSADLSAPPPPGQPPAACGNAPAAPSRTDCVTALIEVGGGKSIMVQAPAHWEESDSSFVFPGTPESACGKYIPTGTGPVHGAVAIVSDRGRVELVVGPRLTSVDVSRAEIEARPGGAGPDAGIPDGRPRDGSP